MTIKSVLSAQSAVKLTSARGRRPLFEAWSPNSAKVRELMERVEQTSPGASENEARLAADRIADRFLATRGSSCLWISPSTQWRSVSGRVRCKPKRIQGCGRNVFVRTPLTLAESAWPLLFSLLRHRPSQEGPTRRNYHCPSLSRTPRLRR